MSGIVRLLVRMGMPCPFAGRPVTCAASTSAGFTLLELLTALAVVSVGAGVIVALFTQSVALGDGSCNQRTAAALAEARLLDLELRPSSYQWPKLEALSEGKLVEVGFRDGEPAQRGYLSACPETTLTFQKGAERVKDYYEGFAWRVFVRLPDAQGNYVEVIVVVQWSEANRPKSLSFTSSLSRSFVEEAA